jgi:type IV secretion system protein VirB9
MIARTSYFGFAIALTTSLSLGACATNLPPKIAYDNPQPATLVTEASTSAATPLPLPDQMKAVPDDPRPPPESKAPTTRVNLANAEARIEPARDGFINAVQVYPYTEGALYQVYTAPGEITDIGLEPGEQLVGSGPVAAGDTVRWIIGDTVSGGGGSTRVHILIKPTRPDISTNLIINTDRRTYYLELRSTPKTYMASVSWRYPEDQLIAIRGSGGASASVDTGLSLSSLNFRYRINGDSPAWRPLRAFDDGRKVYIEFPAGIEQGDMPPLFLIGARGDTELVNYRIRGHHMIVDRLFAAAELRLGDRQQIVRIERTDGSRW